MAGLHKAQQGLGAVELIVSHQFDIHTPGNQVGECAEARLAVVLNKRQILCQLLNISLITLNIFFRHQYHKRIAQYWVALQLRMFVHGIAGNQ